MFFYKVYLPFTIGVLIGMVMAVIVFHAVSRRKMGSSVSQADKMDGDERLVEDGEEAVKILCWMTTTPERLELARHVQQTWGRRCDRLLFMSPTHDPVLPTVVLNISSGWNTECKRNIEALHFIYNNYLDQVDWILETDEDAFIVVDNLRYLLANYNSSTPVYLGSPGDFMAGGAGFVLSKGALTKIIEEGLLNVIYCNRNSIGLDKQWFSFLEVMSVRPLDVVDCHWHNRLFPLSSATDVLRVWYWKSLCLHYFCTDNVISFHPVDWQFKYMLEFLVYGVGQQLRFSMLATQNASLPALGIWKNMSSI